MRVPAKRLGMVAALALFSAAALWMRAQASDTRALPTLVPPGALLYLEAKDFHSVLEEWNRSAEKKRWLASANFQELSISRLIQRLDQVGGEFQSVAAVPIGMNFTDQVAGGKSAFAFYDFSQVAFVYVTQMAQGRVEGTELWRKRASFQEREAAGVPFFVKADKENGRKIVFAAYKDWFVLATDEDRLVQTLGLLSGTKEPSLANDEWFSAAAGQRQEQGDLRLVYNMEQLLRSPQYRTYWVHRNASEMAAFSSGVADLFEREEGFEEERVLLRKVEAPPPATTARLAEVAGFGTAGGGSLVRAWNSPSAPILANVAKQVLFGEGAGARVGQYEPAPSISPEAGAVGSESDLEVRIDEPPFEHSAQQSLTPLLNALDAMQPVALAHVQSTAVLRDQVFVVPESGLVLYCQKPDRAVLERALAQVTNPLQTGSLDPLTVTVSGSLVTVTRGALVRTQADAALRADATYYASYNHATAWPHYKKLFSVLDQAAGSTQPGISQQGPTFFSGNLGSLGDSLARLRQASIISADLGATVRETVQYQMAKP